MGSTPGPGLESLFLPDARMLLAFFLSLIESLASHLRGTSGDAHPAVSVILTLSHIVMGAWYFFYFVAFVTDQSGS